MDEASLSRAASRFRYLYQKYLDDSNKVYLSIIPDKNCYLAEQSGHLSIDYSLLEEQLSLRHILPSPTMATFLPLC